MAENNVDIKRSSKPASLSELSVDRGQPATKREEVRDIEFGDSGFSFSSARDSVEEDFSEIEVKSSPVTSDSPLNASLRNTVDLEQDVSIGDKKESVQVEEKGGASYTYTADYAPESAPLIYRLLTALSNLIKRFEAKFLQRLTVRREESLRLHQENTRIQELEKEARRRMKKQREFEEGDDEGSEEPPLKEQGE